MKKKFYAAYGSNLNMTEMMSRCPKAKLVGTAILEGWRLAFCGCLTIEPHEGSKVPLGIWSIDAADESRLDIYEGAPSYYTKETMTLNVRTDDSVEQLACLIYIMNPDFAFRPRVYEGYYKRCLTGYRDFSFDETLLEDALKRSKEAGR